MPKLPQDTKDLTENDLTTSLNQVLLTSAQTPTVACGITRKVNIGHYETIDVYMGVTIPLVNAELMDMEVLKNQISKAATEGFAVAAKETGDRYMLIKESIKGGRDKVAEEEASE